MKQLFSILNSGSIQSRLGFEGYHCINMLTAKTKWHHSPADIVVSNLIQ